ncbi:hypothetical protein FRB98_002417 [Tulasnella sp. 332]|nr:hypothetical protein FRB98_002417 [Tulasnella sp. 332]
MEAAIANPTVPTPPAFINRINHAAMIGDKYNASQYGFELETLNVDFNAARAHSKDLQSEGMKVPA